MGSGHAPSLFVRVPVGGALRGFAFGRRRATITSEHIPTRSGSEGGTSPSLPLRVGLCSVVRKAELYCSASTAPQVSAQPVFPLARRRRVNSCFVRSTSVTDS